MTAASPTIETPRRRGSCPLCRSSRRDPLFVKDGWPIVRCPGCGIVYVDAALDRAAVDAIYDRGYYEGEAFVDYVAEREERLDSARARAQRLTAVVPGGRLLDIGCATGYFLEAASVHYEVTGVEVSSWAAARAREQFGHTVAAGELADAHLPDGAFDAVTMWDVIEHLREPADVLAEVARVTRPGGLLVITTGNVEGPLARRDLERWNLMFPPGHLLFFSPRTLERLLNAAGFEVERVLMDGRASSRPRLVAPRAQAVAGALGLGNVMTVLARRATAPRPRRLRARFPRRLLDAGGGPRPRPAEDDEWLEIALADPHATFFHTPMWRELALEGLGGCADHSLALSLPSGVRAVFPLQELLPRHARGGRYLLSTYPYGFGGPIADGTLSADDLRMLYRHVHAASTTVTTNPRAAEPPALPGWRRERLTTQAIDLGAGYDALRRGFSKGHRAAIKQAERKGVEVRVAASADDYRAYYSVYEDSLRRWGDDAGRRYPAALFERARRLSQRWPEAVRLWVAERNGEVVAGALILYWNGHAMYWHAANLERAFELRPANLLLARALEDACERGLEQFDFGHSGGHEGPAAFKRRFGATERPFVRLTRVMPALRVTAGVRRAMAQRRQPQGDAA